MAVPRSVGHRGPDAWSDTILVSVRVVLDATSIRIGRQRDADCSPHRGRASSGQLETGTGQRAWQAGMEPASLLHRDGNLPAGAPCSQAFALSGKPLSWAFPLLAGVLGPLCLHHCEPIPKSKSLNVSILSVLVPWSAQTGPAGDFPLPRAGPSWEGRGHRKRLAHCSISG